MKMCFQKLVYKVIVLLPGFLFCFLLGSPIFAATFDRVVARVNNSVITLGTLEDRVTVFSSQMKTSGSVGEQLPKKKLMKGILDEMIAEKLQTQEAKKLGMKVAEKTLEEALDDLYNSNNITSEQFKEMLKNEGSDLEAYKEVIRDQILVARIRRSIIGSGAVKERSIRKYYRKNKKDYWVPEKITASHIMLIKENGSSDKEIQLNKKKAEKILQQVQGGEEFSELAKKYSEDVSAHSGGGLGTIDRGTMMPEFENAAFNLKIGEVSKVVETANGFHIIKCDNIIPGYVKEYKMVRSEIESILRSKKKKKKYEEWLKELKKASFIEISLFQDEKKIKKVRTAGTSERRGSNKPQAIINFDRYLKNQDKSNSKEGLARERFIEEKLKNYKKLYADGKISKKIFLRKKKQLLEKL